MSQHDYVIDNQTFPATRTDLNNALSAIVSQNAGANAPSTTYAYQFWYDTTNDILKMRNSDDDAWIDLFEVDQTNDTAGGTFSGGLVVNGNIDINGNELILDADGDTSITADTDDQIDFKTGGSDRMSIDSSGNVGIGTSSPSEVLDLSAASNPRLRFEDDGDFEYTIGIKDNNAFTISSGGSDDERMRIDSSGNLLVGSTSAVNVASGTTDGVSLKTNNVEISRDGGTPLLMRRRSSNGEMVAFRRDTTFVGSISVTTSSTAYNTSSDHRLKENVTDITGATDRLKQLNPVRFNFIADADTTVDGFLAHEVQDVVPEAITGTKDAMDDDGNPVYQGIDQSKLVPLLVKTIQELEARIAALETA